MHYALYTMLRCTLPQACVHPRQQHTHKLAVATHRLRASQGVLALWTGYPTFVIRICPHIMLTWVFMDTLNDSLRKVGM